jgi:protein phosphatase inhibitor 2
MSASPSSIVLDIPSLDLAGNSSGVSSPVLQSPVSVEPPPSPPVSPHRTSFSTGINGRPSSGRRSGSSSRSTSFSLPNEAKGEISEKHIGPDDEEVEEDEEMDEEGKLQRCVRPLKRRSFNSL